MYSVPTFVCFQLRHRNARHLNRCWIKRTRFPALRISSIRHRYLFFTSKLSIYTHTYIQILYTTYSERVLAYGTRYVRLFFYYLFVLFFFYRRDNSRKTRFCFNAPANSFNGSRAVLFFFFLLNTSPRGWGEECTNDFIIRV